MRAEVTDPRFVVGYAEHCAARWREAQQAVYADETMELWLKMRAKKKRRLPALKRRRRGDPVYRPPVRADSFAEGMKRIGLT